jgi:protein MpaA
VLPAEVRTELVGYSTEGRPIDAIHVGSGRASVLIIAGMNAGTESNAVDLVVELGNYFLSRPDQVPPSLSLIFVPLANPDALAHRSRQAATGVDLNRNWPTVDWQPDVYEGIDAPLPGGGGPQPLSEPETRALADWIERQRPMAIISYHSAVGVVEGGTNAIRNGLLEAYAVGSGYFPMAGVDWWFYPVSGDFLQWADEYQGLPTLEIELSDHVRTEFDRNLAGLRAVLRLLSGQL